MGATHFSGLTLPHAERTGLALGEIAYFTAVPRRYGFHGTLKAPFRLADGVGEAELLDMAEKFSREAEPVVVPKVTVARLGGFFAIVPEEPNRALNEFAGQVVAVFDKLRAPLSEKEFERRDPEKMSTSQTAQPAELGLPLRFRRFPFSHDADGPCRAPPTVRASRPRSTGIFMP